MSLVCSMVEATQASKKESLTDCASCQWMIDNGQAVADEADDTRSGRTA